MDPVPDGLGHELGTVSGRINAGTLDNPNTFEPEEEIWTQSKVAFATISGDIRSYPRASSG